MFLLFPAPGLLHGSRCWWVPVLANPPCHPAIRDDRHRGGGWHLPAAPGRCGEISTSAAAGRNSPFVSCCQMFLCKNNLMEKQGRELKIRQQHLALIKNQEIMLEEGKPCPSLSPPPCRNMLWSGRVHGVGLHYVPGRDAGMKSHFQALQPIPALRIVPAPRGARGCLCRHRTGW